MDIRGLTKFSLIDFPGRITCILFAGGCNFRCPYCHNPHLVIDPESQPRLSDSYIFNFLEKRRGKIDGVVISGGEPSMYPALPGFLEKIKTMGFLIKLDTNGSYPDVIISIHKSKCLDAIGIDYKAPSSGYSEITGTKIKDIVVRIHKTISYCIKNKVPMDLRTTVHKRFHTQDVLKKMRYELNTIGAGAWTLQQFHPSETIDDSLADEKTYSDHELIDMAKSLGNHTRVRGLKGSFIFDS